MFGIRKIVASAIRFIKNTTRRITAVIKTALGLNNEEKPTNIPSSSSVFDFSVTKSCAKAEPAPEVRQGQAESGALGDETASGAPVIKNLIAETSAKAAPNKAAKAPSAQIKVLKNKELEATRGDEDAVSNLPRLRMKKASPGKLSQAKKEKPTPSLLSRIFSNLSSSDEVSDETERA